MDSESECNTNYNSDEFVSGITLPSVAASVLTSSRIYVPGQQEGTHNNVLEARERTLEEQLTSYVAEVTNLSTQLKEERQTHRAERETLEGRINKLESKVKELTKQHEEDRTVYRTVETLKEQVTSLIQDVRSLSPQVLEREDHDTQSIHHSRGNERLHEAPPTPNYDHRPPVNDQEPTLYSLQVVNPINDDRLSEEKPSLVLLQRINPIFEEDDRPPNLLNLGYNSLCDVALSDDQLSYSFLQRMNPIVEDEVEPMGYSYLHVLNPISD